MKTRIFAECMLNEEFELFTNYMISSGKVGFFDDNLLRIMQTVKLQEGQSLYDYFDNGFNNGYCGFTCMLLSLLFENCELVEGKNSYLKGTENSPNGEHMWLNVDGNVYDTSLGLVYSAGNALGYEDKSRLTKEELLKCEQYKILNDLLLNQEPLLANEEIANQVMKFILESSINKSESKLI